MFENISYVFDSIHVWGLLFFKEISQIIINESKEYRRAVFSTEKR